MGKDQRDPPCTVCGKPYEQHGTYPTCASHVYTPDGLCRTALRREVGGAIHLLLCRASNECKTKGCAFLQPR